MDAGNHGTRFIVEMSPGMTRTVKFLAVSVLLSAIILTAGNIVVAAFFSPVTKKEEE